jgi:hypothetical protein
VPKTLNEWVFVGFLFAAGFYVFSGVMSCAKLDSYNNCIEWSSRFDSDNKNSVDFGARCSKDLAR